MNSKIKIIIIIFSFGFLYSEECSCNNRMYQVCGNDGFTYPNKCIAECFNTEIAYIGPCMESNISGCPDGSLICLGADYEDDCYNCPVNKYSIFSKYTESNHLLFTANAESLYGTIQIDMQTDIDRSRVNSFKITLTNLDEEWKEKIEAVKVLAEINIPFENNSYTIDLLNIYNYNYNYPDREVPVERYRK